MKKSSTYKKNTGGRPPQIEDGTLFNRRDSLIQTLSDAWGNIGWELKCVQTPDELREALGGLGGIIYENQRRPLQSLLQSTILPASAEHLRATRRKIQNAGRRSYEILGTVGIKTDSKPTLNSATESLQETELAIKTVSNENLEPMLDEHLNRLSVYMAFKQEMEEIEKERKAFETQLSNEEAFFAKNELFRFIRCGKYAHNPRNLANAMAGIPEIGCWQSLQRCEKQSSPLWPTRPDEIPPRSYQLFEIIAYSWNQFCRRTDLTFLSQLRYRILTIPESNGLRSYATKEWRYLRQAVEQIDAKQTVSGAVPYRIFAAFMENIAQPRSMEETILAAKEQNEIAESAGSSSIAKREE